MSTKRTYEQAYQSMLRAESPALKAAHERGRALLQAKTPAEVKRLLAAGKAKA